MLAYSEDNLFDSTAQTLVNPVNTEGAMGKGLALAFRRRYPQMHARYRAMCTAGTLRIGTLYLARTSPKWVLNFPTKQEWSLPSKLEYLEAGLGKFASHYAAQGITSIAFPQLGCGNGGLAWADVQPLMERYLAPLELPVTIHLAAEAPEPVEAPTGDVRGRPGHHCHLPGCNVPVPPKLLFCARHWALVPPAIQREVWRTFNPQQCVAGSNVRPTRAWFAAADAAIAAASRVG